MRGRRVGAWVTTWALVSVGCATPLPPDQTASVLYRDLRRLVSLRQSSGWGIDRLETEDLMPAALLSICETPASNRRRLADWLDARLQSLGGPVELAYIDRGRDLDAVSELLLESRVAELLQAGAQVADVDCPFWIEPRADFPGRQIQDDRWLVTAGGGGKLIVVSQEGRFDVNFGGAGRVLVGRGFGRRWAVFTGVEAGGSAQFPRGDAGRDGLVLTIDGVVPVVTRYRLENSYLELEVGYLAHLTEQSSTSVQHGFRVGAAFGLQYTRQLVFLPGLAFGVAYERTLTGSKIPLHLMKLGFRGVFDVSL